MRPDDLLLLYRELRRELHRAYLSRPWNGARIDRIAADLLQLERTLLLRQAAAGPPQRPRVQGSGYSRSE